MEEKISVVVPIHNVEKYLKKCVDSILGQTYSNIEVILVDDESSDNCGKICDMYAERDKRVLVIHKEYSGVADTRNVGMQVATGEYIAFVDSDDYLEPDMFEVLYNRIQKDESDLAICNFLYVDEEGKLLEARNINSPISDALLTGEEAFACLAKEKYWYYITVWNKLYRKWVLNDISFPKGKVQEDEGIAHYILAKCKKVSCVKEPLYMYVQRKHSIMNAKYTIKNLDAIEAFCSRVLFAKNRNKAVMEKSLEKAGNLLLKAYRNFGKEDKYKGILKEKRKLYNKAYREAFSSGLHIGTAIKYGIVFFHPNIYIGIAKVLKLEKKEEKH